MIPVFQGKTRIVFTTRPHKQDPCQSTILPQKQRNRFHPLSLFSAVRTRTEKRDRTELQNVKRTRVPQAENTADPATVPGPPCFPSIDRPLSFDRDDRRVLAGLLGDELHLAVLEGEKREVTTTADVGAGVDLRAALADDDGTGLEELAVVSLDTEILRVRVATVAGRCGSSHF